MSRFSFWFLVSISLVLVMWLCGVMCCINVVIGIISMLCVIDGSWYSVVMCWEMIFECGLKML